MHDNTRIEGCLGGQLLTTHTYIDYEKNVTVIKPHNEPEILFCKQCKNIKDAK